MTDTLAVPHQITRIRRDPVLRTLTVQRVETPTPNLRRLHFSSSDLHNFDSAAPDDHIKLFVPDPTQTGGPRPGFCMRDYTPRKFDAAEGLLTIDFALHEAGPATAWALSARLGDELQIGGPRGSTLIADDFDWYLLIGDETALPAIGRRVEELRSGVPVTTVVLVDSNAERQTFATRAAWASQWVCRSETSGADTKRLLDCLETLPLPSGEGFIWIAAEAQVARALRAYMVEKRGHPRAWVKASGYWTQGAAATHEKLDD
jgi:NADPH-dependent ferric siderophore reductase